MAEVIANTTELNELIIPIIAELLTEQFSWISTIVQAIGILLIIYIIYFITSTILEFNNRKRIKRIEAKIDKLNEKITTLTKKPKKKRKSL